MLNTQVVPWWCLEELAISHRDKRRQKVSARTPLLEFRIVVHNAKAPERFGDSVDRVLGTTRGGSDLGTWPPSRSYRRLRVALWVLLFLFLFGARVLEGSLVQDARYTARASRDRSTIATVVASRILEHDDSEGGTGYSTQARVVFEAGIRPIATTIERRGRHRFPDELELPIVYDPLYPSDADFGDGPNRKSDAANARGGIWAGAIMGAIGVVAGMVLGTLMLCIWLRHRGRSPVLRASHGAWRSLTARRTLR